MFLVYSHIGTVAALPHDESTGTPSKPPGHRSACFITGKFAIPEDVVINPHVHCLGKQPGVYDGVPEVYVDNSGFSVQRLTFSRVRFQVEGLNLSPVGFAWSFFTPETRDEQVTTRLESVLAVYLATNAGLRSLGPKMHSEVAKIKGPCFYLEFQLAISQGKLDVAAHKLRKVLKNCVECKHGEKEKVIQEAKNHGVAVPASSSPK